MNDNDKPVNEESGSEENFAELLAQSFKQSARLATGDKVEAKILKISGDWIFLDTGRKGEGVLDRKELLDRVWGYRAASEIESVGMGSERPLVKPDDTPAKQAKNRRYELQVKL